MLPYTTGAENGAPATPLWLGIASLLVAFVAVVISFIGTRATVRDLRRSPPRVSLHLLYTDRLHMDAHGPRQAVVVSLSNTGREPTEVNMILVKNTGPTVDFAVNGGVALLDGDVLPVRLEGHARRSWTVDMSGLACNPLPPEVRVTVTLGHGVTLEQTVDLNQSRKRGPYSWPHSGHSRG